MALMDERMTQGFKDLEKLIRDGLNGQTAP